MKRLYINICIQHCLTTFDKEKLNLQFGHHRRRLGDRAHGLAPPIITLNINIENGRGGILLENHRPRRKNMGQLK
jgi:hypothetical protein